MRWRIVRGLALLRKVGGAGAAEMLVCWNTICMAGIWGVGVSFDGVDMEWDGRAWLT